MAKQEQRASSAAVHGTLDNRPLSPTTGPLEEVGLSPETARLLERLRLGYKPLGQRLEALRNRARSGARTATWLGVVSSLVILLLLGLVVGGLLWGFNAAGANVWSSLNYSQLPPRLRTVLVIEMVVVPFALLFALGRLTLMLLTLHRVFGYYYSRAQRLFSQGEARFYVEEEYHKLLADARELGLGWSTVFMPAEKQRTLERELEYLACYAVPLHYAAWLQPIRGRFEYAHAQQSYRAQPVFNIAPGIWGLVLLIGAVPFSLFICTLIVIIARQSPNVPLPFFLPYLMPFSTFIFALTMIPLGLAHQQAPRYIISRAYLVALLDFLLGRGGEAAPAPLIRPVPPGTIWQRMRDWYLRQSAPWSWRGKAPE